MSCLQKQVCFNLWSWGLCLPWSVPPLLSPNSPSPQSLRFNPRASVFLFSHLWVSFQPLLLPFVLVWHPLEALLFPALLSECPPTLSPSSPLQFTCSLSPFPQTPHFPPFAVCPLIPFLCLIPSTPLPQPQFISCLSEFHHHGPISFQPPGCPQLSSASSSSLCCIISSSSCSWASVSHVDLVVSRPNSHPGPCPPPHSAPHPPVDSHSPQLLTQRQLHLPGRGQQLVWGTHLAHPLSHWSCWASL